MGEKELSDPQAHRHTSRLSRGLLPHRRMCRGAARGARTAVAGSQFTFFLASMLLRLSFRNWVSEI